ncbi:MAG: hypothetical protein OEM05_15300, partial [Myxococcales bacterium]|nr:hypothetical protein [Myxococcales bacterium]
MADQESFAFGAKAGGGRTARGGRKPSAQRGAAGRRRSEEPAKPTRRTRKPGSARKRKPAKPPAASRRASGRTRRPEPEGAPGDAGSGTGARTTAAELAKKQRDISISEFFAKNRHLLGF